MTNKALTCTDADGLTFAIVSVEKGVILNATDAQIQSLIINSEPSVQGIGVLLREIKRLRKFEEAINSALINAGLGWAKCSSGLSGAQELMDKSFVESMEKEVKDELNKK